MQSAVQEEDYVSGRLFAPPEPAKSTNTPRPQQKRFKPLRPRSSVVVDASDKPPPAMHNPCAKDAIVLLPAISKGASVSIPIVLDPFLGKRMRPHQSDGIRFLFECTVGRVLQTQKGGEGAILADEMGLGKSLQAIALVWTLLKQGPYGTPLAKKAVIVCPASLVPNWVNEIRKWLGDERLKPVALESGVSTFESKQAMAAFIGGTVRKLLVISYEMFRANAENLYSANVGLMICDEGHRLKSAGGNKTIDALRKLPCKRRVILTGTPVQNDLEEFYAVCDFVNPGCLNSLSSFRSVFAHPIIASRDSNAAPSTVRLGSARAAELSRVTSQFVLRRTSSLLERYLPPKLETAIFCRLQPKQAAVYDREAQRRFVDYGHSRDMSLALCAINHLRKACSHPALIQDEDSDSSEEVAAGSNFTGKQHGRVGGTPDFDVNDSVKMQVTAAICEASLAVQDRVIIVSNFTTVLDLVEMMMKESRIKFCRLDGSTPVNQRGGIVRRFNEGSLGDVFLLSAKAGGVGLNLIGANRLILFDPDWNPATDIQAMARVWRDGQKKPVFVYRLLCTGTIEEKIFQRQLFKGELLIAVDGEHTMVGASEMGGKEGNFSAEELKDVFQYNGDVEYCETLLVLERSQDDDKRDGASKKPEAGLLEVFREYKQLAEKEMVRDMVWCGEDKVLGDALNANLNTHGLVSYMFTKKSGGNQKAVNNVRSGADCPNTTGVKRKRESIVKNAALLKEGDGSSSSSCDSAILRAAKKKMTNELSKIQQAEDRGGTCESGKVPVSNGIGYREGIDGDGGEETGGEVVEVGVAGEDVTVQDVVVAEETTWDEALKQLEVDI